MDKFVKIYPIDKMRKFKVSKKNKKQQSSQVPVVNSVDNFNYEDVYPSYRKGVEHQYPVNVPVPVHMDTMARYLDDELYSWITQYENERIKVLDAKMDPFPWEIEIAYLRREAGIRKIRRELHENFLRENSQLVLDDVNFEEDFDVEFEAATP